MNRRRRAVVSGRTLGAGALACAALLAVAPAAHAREAVSVEKAVAHVDAVTVTLAYTCSDDGFTDTFQVKVTDTANGGQFRSVGTVRCDGKKHRVVTEAQRLAGPRARSGNESVISVSLGSGFGGFFTPTVSRASAKVLV